MNPYLGFIQKIESEIKRSKSLHVSGKRDVVESQSKVLLFSPHPDDECITGLLPLRLMREAGKQIINIPITFGRNEERQAGRAAELEAACGYLGWKNYRKKAGFQALEIADVVAVLEQFQPEIIFMPHAKDWNSRHISTHFLVVDALKQMGRNFSCTVVETEFWGAMDDPNMMVEGDAPLLADLVAATSLHVEEVARNPYHLLLPAWMQDNVRRGGELIGGQGGAVPSFSFATLYRVRQWEKEDWSHLIETGKIISIHADDLTEMFQWK